jgi:hypothetical protein
MTEHNQITKEQAIEILKNVTVSFDINENAIVISTKKLLLYFLSNTKELDKIIKVDVDENNEMTVYASVKPSNPNIKSAILKVVLKPDAFKIQYFKYKLIKTDDDVHIKIYIGQDKEGKVSDANADGEIDF